MPHYEIRPVAYSELLADSLREDEGSWVANGAQTPDASPRATRQQELRQHLIQEGIVDTDGAGPFDRAIAQVEDRTMYGGYFL